MQGIEHCFEHRNAWLNPPVNNLRLFFLESISCLHFATVTVLMHTHSLSLSLSPSLSLSLSCYRKWFQRHTNMLPAPHLYKCLGTFWKATGFTYDGHGPCFEEQVVQICLCSKTITILSNQARGPIDCMLL